MNDDDPASGGASMIDREALLRADNSRRKPQNAAVGSLAARPGPPEACCIRRTAA
jgi:hypothetical protein